MNTPIGISSLTDYINQIDEITDTEKSHLYQWHLWSPTLDNQVVETQRMIIQQSVFLFGLPEVDPEMVTQEIIVHSDAKEKIRTTLEKMGISGKTLFSDLLGFFERNSAAQPYNLTVDALGD